MKHPPVKTIIRKLLEFTVMAVIFFFAITAPISGWLKAVLLAVVIFVGWLLLSLSDEIAKR